MRIARASSSARSGAAAWATIARRSPPAGVRASELLDERLERPSPTPHAPQRADLAVVDRQDRSNREQAADERLGGADPPAPAQELERLDENTTPA
jgi:hypothetical protein